MKYVRSSADARDMLRKLGFVVQEDSTHARGFLIVDGSLRLIAHVPAGDSDLSPTILERLRRAIHLDPPEFLDACALKMEPQQYIEILRKRGVASD